MGEDVKTVRSARRTGRERIESLSFSPFGESFDNGRAYQARRSAREVMDSSGTPKLYGSTSMDFGEQGQATVRRVGTQRKGTLQTTLMQNGKPMAIGDVQYNEDGRGMFRKSADDAFSEVKRRLRGYVKV